MNDSSRFFSLSQTLAGCNLYLVGMMGSGKSQTGPHLAEEIGYSFVDMDDVIQKAPKKTISEIFQDDGESGFRQFESEVLKQIGTRHSLVEDTGGGVVTTSKNWSILHQGIVIWIDPGRDRLLKRIKSDLTIRPLLQETDPEKTFDVLLEERQPLYIQSDCHLKVEDESPQEVSVLILETLLNLLNKKAAPSE